MVTPVRTAHDLHPRTASGAAPPEPIHYNFIVMTGREAHRRARWQATERVAVVAMLAGACVREFARARANHRPDAV